MVKTQGEKEHAIAAKLAKIKSLEAQVQSFLIDESAVIDLQQHVNNLKSLRDAQSATLDSLGG